MGRLAFVVLALALCIGDLHAASHQYRRNRMEQGSGLENKELIAMVKKYLHNKVTEKQVEIDRRDLERRGLPKCADCENTVLPDCSPGLSMIPIWKNRTEGPDQTDCVCLVEYTCCPDNCDQNLTDAIKECKNGFDYKAEYTDCCGCKKYECLPCPTQTPRVCPDCTEWNKNVYQNSKTECPVGDCQRIQKPTPTAPACNLTCHYVEHGADECGFPTAKCKCATPPNCRPKLPEDRDCHTIEPIESKSIFMCDKKDSNQCTPCYSYTYKIIEPTVVKTKCNLHCQIPEVKKGKCGSYEQTCKCLEPANCEPQKLEEIPCHHIVRVESTNAFKCQSNVSTGQCQPCYHWKYVQDEVPTTGPAEVCDSRCEIERVVQTGCGVHEKECYCNGITKRQCQPAEPTGLGKCYFAVKILLNDSFMCDGNKECVQCWRWDLPKKPCATVPTVNCDPKCKREVRRQNECGCDRFECVAIVPPNCFPDEPEHNKCYTAPIKKFLEPDLFSEKNNVCEQCYNWTMVHKPFPPIKCVENPKCLPKHCWNRWPTRGDCGQSIEKCALINEECEKTFDECPCGFEKLTRWSSCKQRRDICIDCSEGVNKNPPPTENKQCYEEYDGKYMEVCTIKMWRKKKCDFSGLDVSVCPNGGANKITINKCGCPVSTCTPCSNMDVQLLVDGSGSIMGDRFKVVGETLAASFLPPLSAAAGNRVALAFFGDNLVSKRTLVQGLDPARMRKYSYPRLGRTLTAKALNELLEQFKKDMRPDATKVLVVITDGNENGGGDVAAAAAAWGGVVDRIYAIGCGGQGVTDEGLALIAKHYHHNLDSVADLQKEVTFSLIPQMCPV